MPGEIVARPADKTLPKLCPTNTRDFGIPSEAVYFPAFIAVVSCSKIDTWIEA